VRPIVHRRRIAAQRVYHASHIEVLEPDHTDRHFVAALCLYSHAVDSGGAGRSSSIPMTPSARPAPI